MNEQPRRKKVLGPSRKEFDHLVVKQRRKSPQGKNGHRSGTKSQKAVAMEAREERV